MKLIKFSTKNVEVKQYRKRDGTVVSRFLRRGRKKKDVLDSTKKEESLTPSSSFTRKGAIALAATLGIGGVGLLVDRRFKVVDKGILEAYKGLNSSQVTNLMTSLEKSSLPNNLKTQIKSLTGAAKVFTAKTILERKGAKFLGIDIQNNFSTFRLNNRIVSVSSIEDKILTFESLQIGKLGGKYPIYQMNFRVNEDFARNPNIPFTQSKRIIRATKAMFSDHIENTDDQAILQGIPFLGDSVGAKRNSIYQQYGFQSLGSSDGSLWALKDKGKFRKIRPEEADVLRDDIIDQGYMSKFSRFNVGN